MDWIDGVPVENAGNSSWNELGRLLQFDAIWSESVLFQASVTTTTPFRIMSGTTIIASTSTAAGDAAGAATDAILLTATAGPTASKVRLTATIDGGHAAAAIIIPGGNYTLTAAAGAVRDTSTATNAHAATSTPLPGLATGAPFTGCAPGMERRGSKRPT